QDGDLPAGPTECDRRNGRLERTRAGPGGIAQGQGCGPAGGRGRLEEVTPTAFTGTVDVKAVHRDAFPLGASIRIADLPTPSSRGTSVSHLNCGEDGRGWSTRF